MRISSQIGACGALTALFVILGVQRAARADDPPAGETWRQTVSMHMASMSMPPYTADVCVSPGKATEALSTPQGPGIAGNCRLQGAKHVGKKYTAKFICTGQQVVQGRVETVTEAGHVKATMTMSVNGQPMTMKTDSQKTGTSCALNAVPAGK